MLPPNKSIRVAIKDGQEVFALLKRHTHEQGLKGLVRVNRAGCLDACATGVSVVVYPEAVWYTFVDNADIDEIIDSHLKKGQVVERLRLPDDVGR